MARNIQAICLSLGFGIMSYISFSGGEAIVGSLAAFCSLVELLVLVGAVLSLKLETKNGEVEVGFGGMKR